MRFVITHYMYIGNGAAQEKRPRDPRLHQLSRLVSCSRDPCKTIESNAPFRCEIRDQDHENRKSFRTGDPANSGLSKTQLKISQSIDR